MLLSINSLPRITKWQHWAGSEVTYNRRQPYNQSEASLATITAFLFEPCRKKKKILFLRGPYMYHTQNQINTEHFSVTIVLVTFERDGRTISTMPQSNDTQTDRILLQNKIGLKPKKQQYFLNQRQTQWMSTSKCPLWTFTFTWFRYREQSVHISVWGICWQVFYHMR